ncbi:hypothetical protein V1524DRAFT_457682 [Lipomyces starkeyi]
MASPKIVLVTGGNDEIGYEAKGKAAIEKLRKESPGVTNTVEVVQVDLHNDESTRKAFEQVKASPGTEARRLDALVNNAGATFDIEYVAGKISLRDCLTRPTT